MNDALEQTDELTVLTIEAACCECDCEPDCDCGPDCC